jgi:DDE domain
MLPNTTLTDLHSQRTRATGRGGQVRTRVRGSSDTSACPPLAPDAPVPATPGYSRRTVLPSPPMAPSKIMPDNNVVEQDYRGIKRKVRPMMGFKSFWSASVTLAGIELMQKIRKGSLKATGRGRPAQQFYSLATRLSWWRGTTPLSRRIRDRAAQSRRQPLGPVR